MEILKTEEKNHSILCIQHMRLSNNREKKFGLK